MKRLMDNLYIYWQTNFMLFHICWYSNKSYVFKVQFCCNLDQYMTVLLLFKEQDLNGDYDI